MKLSEALLPKVGWGKYGGYEGPVFWGSRKYIEPENPTFNQKLMSVITATEGGHLNAVNMYDKCALTVGVIQWGELCAPRSVSKMIGLCAERSEQFTNGLLAEVGLSVARNPDKGGEWAVKYGNAFMYGEALTRAAFLGTTGREGQWGAGKWLYARQVCAVMATLFAQDFAAEAQMSFTAPQLLSFAFGSAGRTLFAKDYPTEGWAGALRAVYISFAANLPGVALSVFNRVWSGLAGLSDKDKCIALTKELTFVGVGIYPRRYDMIRPVVEKLFSVDLPDYSAELSKWRDSSQFTFSDPFVLQRALKWLGYDLGPSGPLGDGVDGKIMTKTIAAIRGFQRDRKIQVDGAVGPITSRQLVIALAEIGKVPS